LEKADDAAVWGWREKSGILELLAFKNSQSEGSDTGGWPIAEATFFLYPVVVDVDKSESKSTLKEIADKVIVIPDLKLGA
jgi:hypothetical protein